MIDKGVNLVSIWFIWNPSNCECECNKSCDVGEYLDYETCKCRKRLIDKLIEKYTENLDKVNLAGINLTKNKHKLSFYTLYIVLFSIIFTINIWIDTYFVYYKYMNRNKELVSRYDMSIKQQIININRKYQTN